MSCKRSRSPEMELRLNLPARGGAWSSSESESESVSIFAASSSVENSCVSSCEGEELADSSSRREGDEIITRSMVLVGCPGCFMYVMLTDKTSQCPKCKNNVFLDFFKDDAYKN